MTISHDRSVKDLLICIAQNLDGLRPGDPHLSEKIDRAVGCFNRLWLLFGYEKTVRPCLGGDIIRKR